MSAATTRQRSVLGRPPARIAGLEGVRIGFGRFMNWWVSHVSATRPRLSGRNPKNAHVFAWLATLGFCAPVFAQMDTATLSGRIADVSGTAVTRARVDLIDIERNIRTITRTNEGGFYIFPDIKPGHYRVEVSAAGYKSVNLANLTIYTQADLAAQITLAAGSPLESVILNANGTPTQMSGAVGTVIDQTLVTELPLNGRSFQTLFALTPGVVITPSSPTSQGQFSVNGQRANANYVVIDGVSANFGLAAGVNPGQSAGGSLPALTAFGGTNSLISTGDVQEFAVLTSSYSAEFGRVPGGQVSIVSRSGTNEFHGNVFDYVRNDALDANDWFSNRNRLARAPLRQNDFGLVFGGPISKDKTFFFASYEGLRLRQPTSRETDVPSLPVRNSAPLSMKPFFEAYPLPNGPDRGNGLARATYAFSNPSILDAVSVRIDYHRRESLSLFARYVISASDRRQRGAQPNSLSTVTGTRVGLQTLTAGLTYFVTPQFMTDFRFNWSASSVVGEDKLDSFGGATPLSPGAVFPSHFNQKNSLFQLFPAIGPANIALTLGRDNNSFQHQINILSNLSLQFRAHVVKAGFDFRSLSPQVTPPAYDQTTFFPDIESALTSTTLFSAVAATVTVHSHFTNYSAYVQDAWRPGARLNLTYGIRWEYNPAPIVQGGNGRRPFAVQGIDDLRTLSLAPGIPLYRTTLNNFGPRVGIAYDVWRSPRFRSVMRGGAGTFFDLGNGPVGNVTNGFSFPFLTQKFLFGVPFPLSSDKASPPAFTTRAPFSTIQAFPSVLKLPYSYHWNLSLEQSLGTDQTVSVGFLGAVGHGLLRTERYLGGAAGVPAVFTELFFTNGGGFSNYNALQVQFRRRSRNGSHIIASYILSHSLDNVSTDATLQGLPARFINPRSDYGPSDFDTRHTATVGLSYNLCLAGKSWISKALFSNWFIDPLLMVHSSQPVELVLLRDIGFGVYPFRPDLISAVSQYVADQAAPGGRRINSAALLVPRDKRQGDLGRNFFRGFSFFQVDVGIGRHFRVSHNLDLLGRIEAFNIFNHPNFSPPANHLGRVNPHGGFVPQNGFGISQTMLAQGLQAGSFNTGLSPLYQIGSARSVQLALRVEF
jgi:hypothetical protein